MHLRPDPRAWWRIAPEWQGETAFIVGGGPSVAGQDLEQLRGRRVVAINSSYGAVPFADILFFGDLRWWNQHHKQLVHFRGRIVTCRKHPGIFKKRGRAEILELERKPPPGLAPAPTAVTYQRTSYVATINMLVHLGVARIVALGLDGKPDDEWIRSGGARGRSHHHAPHADPVKPNCWKEQAVELRSLVEPLKALGVDLVNASPGSVYDFWPRVRLEDCL